MIATLRQALVATATKPILLIKGSRSMRLERIVQALRGETDAARETQP